MSARYFLVIFAVAFIVAPSLDCLSDGKSITEVKPSCLVRGWPHKMLLLGYLPSHSSNDDIFYSGHYCYPNKTSRYCLKPPFSYKKSFNCTQKISNGVDLKCNMTEIIRKLYPCLSNLSIRCHSSKTLCMVISASNKTSTSFSKFKCCNILTSAKFSAIEDLKVTTPAKGQINVTWRSPSDIDNNIKGSIKYIFYLTSIDSDINKTITISPSVPRSRLFFHIIKNLHPYTWYMLTGRVFMLSAKSDGGDFCKPVVILTMPEAPSVPPVITKLSVVSKNASTRSVAVKWMHPAKEKRNGLIIQTVMEYQRQTDKINETLPYYIQHIVKGNWTNAIIKGLAINADYILTLRSCTSPGDCSNRSDKIILEGIGPKVNPTITGVKVHSLAFILSLVFLALASSISTVVCLVYCLKSHAKRDGAGYESPSIDQLPEDITIVQDDMTPQMEEMGADDHIYTQFRPKEISSHDQAAILQVDNASSQPSYNTNKTERIFLSVKK